MDEDTGKAIWNADDEVLKTLIKLKQMFIEQMHAWKIEEAYRTLRSIRMEAEAKFSKDERKHFVTLMDNLEQTKQLYITDKKLHEGEFFNKLEKTYISLNRCMKANGLFFRESDDDYGL